MPTSPVDSAALSRKTLVRAGAILIALIIGLLLLWAVRPFVLLVFFTILLALPLSAAASFLNERFKIPRGVAVALLMVTAIGLLVGAGMLLAKPVTEQMKELRSQLPRAIDRAEAWLERRPFVEEVVLGGTEIATGEASAGGGEAGPGGQSADETAGGEAAVAGPTGRDSEGRPLGSAGAPGDGRGEDPAADGAGAGKVPLSGRVAAEVRNHAGSLFPFVISTVTAISGILLAIFLIIYFAANPTVYRHGFLRLVPEEHRRRTAEVGDEVATTLTRWLGAQAISMAVIGAISTVTLYFLDVKAALALGVIAGLSEFIPVFGPIISAIPAIGIAFADSPTKALYVLIAYVVIQQLESNVVAPLVMKKGVDVPPVVTILSGTIMTILFGFLGLLVAVPLAAAILTAGKELTTPVDEAL